ALAGLAHGCERPRPGRSALAPGGRAGGHRRGERQARGPGRSGGPVLRGRAEPLPDRPVHGDEDGLAPDGGVTEPGPASTTPSPSISTSAPPFPVAKPATS